MTPRPSGSPARSAVTADRSTTSSALIGAERSAAATACACPGSVASHHSSAGTIEPPAPARARSSDSVVDEHERLGLVERREGVDAGDQVQRDRDPEHGRVQGVADRGAGPVEERLVDDGRQRRGIARQDGHRPGVAEELGQRLDGQGVRRPGTDSAAAAGCRPGRRSSGRRPRRGRWASTCRPRRRGSSPRPSARSAPAPSRWRCSAIESSMSSPIRCSGPVGSPPAAASGIDELGALDADRTGFRPEPRDPTVAVDEVEVRRQPLVARGHGLEPVDGRERRVVGQRQAAGARGQLEARRVGSTVAQRAQRGQRRARPPRRRAAGRRRPSPRRRSRRACRRGSWSRGRRRPSRPASPPITPGIDRNAPPRAQAGMSLAGPGDIRTSEPAVHAAWSAWLCVQVAACADANVPSAAARIRSSAARVYRSGRRATCRLPSEAMRPRVRASPRSASSARRGTIRIASTAPPTRPIAGAATSSGSTPERPAGVAGERRAVQPELEHRDHGQHDQGEVEPEALRQRAAGLPPDGRPHARDADAGQERRDRQRDQGDDGAERGGREGGRAGQRGRQPDALHRRVEPDGLHQQHRQPRRGDRGGHDDQQRLAERHRREVPGARAARPQQGGLACGAAPAAGPRRGSPRTPRARRTGRAAAGSRPGRRAPSDRPRRGCRAASWRPRPGSCPAGRR